MAWSKLSRQERGYGAAWDRVRKVVLKRDCDLCQVCKAKGIYTPARTVDHIVSKANAERLGWTKERMDHPRNLQTICEPCHAIKTEAEQGKKKQAKRVIGPDGWAVEE